MIRHLSVLCSQPVANIVPKMSSRHAKHSLDREISPPPLKRHKAEVVQVKKETVSDFFKPISQKQKKQTEIPKMTKGQIVWNVVQQTCLCGRFDVPDNREEIQSLPHNKTENKTVKRIAGFDFDGTLVKTKSGYRFARGGDDWVWWSPLVPSRLRELHSQGYLLAILTNQKAVSIRKQIVEGKPESKSLVNLKKRLSGVIEALNLPIMVYAATEDDQFRKPSRGMWDELVGANGFNIKESVDLDSSIFVGDAAGRKEDHSAVDRDFATNAGISFLTPEEAFLDQQKVKTIDVAEISMDTERNNGKKTTQKILHSVRTMKTDT